MNLLSDECFDNIFSDSVGCPQSLNPLLSVSNIFLVDISFWETCIGVVSFVVVVSPYLGSQKLHDPPAAASLLTISFNFTVSCTTFLGNEL